MRTARRLFAAGAAALCGGALLVAGPAAQAADTLLSQGRPTLASSQENGGAPAAAAVDGRNDTRWGSAWSDPQWLRVDLGSSATITQVLLRWETAYARAYQIQTSTDGTAWTTVKTVTNGTGGTETHAVTGSGRYVRMNGTARGTGYGYSLWEFEVYGGGTPGTDPGPGPEPGWTQLWTDGFDGPAGTSP